MATEQVSTDERTRYMRITHAGQRVICSELEGASMIAGFLEDGEPDYLAEYVSRTPEEIEALPEFGGW